MKQRKIQIEITPIAEAQIEQAYVWYRERNPIVPQDKDLMFASRPKLGEGDWGTGGGGERVKLRINTLLMGRFESESLIRSRRKILRYWLKSG